MKHLTRAVLAWALLISTQAILAQSPQGTQLDHLSQRYAQRSWEAVRQLLSIPNDAHFAADIERNVQWMEDAFQERGFKTTRLPTETVPLLLAECPSKDGAETLLVYLQVDGQPVDPSRWHQQSPWHPVLKEGGADGVWREIPWAKLQSEFDPDWRIFARSASDAKGPVCMFLAALDAVEGMQERPAYGIKVIMDFEEELGSPHLPDAVTRYRDALTADRLIILDGPRHISNEPTLSFGARGISTITLTVHGPRSPQHSGHYGNYVPNPAMRLAQLLGSMKDEEGRVTLAGFYDGVRLDEYTKRILATVPDDQEAIQRSLGIAGTDGVGTSYQESIQFPSLNIRGLAAGWVGHEVRTIIPATATAEIDIRTVPEVDPARLLQLVREHVIAEGYHLIEGEPTEEERSRYPKIASFRARTEYQAFRTPLDSEVGHWLSRAMTRAFDKEPVKIRISGGSIPISPFVGTLGVPAVAVPTVNPDNNQHSPNENIRLGNYVDGVKTFIAILTEPF